MKPERPSPAPGQPRQASPTVVGGGRWHPVSQLRSLVRPLRVRDYRLLWMAQVCSELGDWATRLALMLLVYHETHSPVLSASVVTVSLLPWVGLGQVLTTAVDHLPRRTVMIAADLGRALVFAILVFPVPTAALFVGAFLAGLGTAPFESARHALRVEVTDDRSLYGGAITLFNITAQLTSMLGFAVGGILVAVVGPRATFAVNSASFVASACFVAAIRVRSAGRKERAGNQAYLGASIRFLYGDPVLRWCSVLSLTSAFAGMGIEAIAAVYGHGHPAKVAALAVAVPAGSVLAYALAPHEGRPRRLLRAAGLLPLLGGALGLVAFGLGGGIVLGVLGFAASGAAVAVPAPAGPVVSQRLVSSLRAPTFSVLQGATLGCTALGAAVGGVLAGIFGARPTCVAACAALALVGLSACARLPSTRPPAVVPEIHRRRLVRRSRGRADRQRRASVDFGSHM